MAVHPGGPHPRTRRGPDVVLESERHVQDGFRRLPDPLERAGEDLVGRLVGADVLRDLDVVEGDLDLAERVLDDVAIGVRDDHEPQPRGARPLERGPGVGERLPAPDRPDHRPSVGALLVRPVQLLAQKPQTFGEHLAVGAVSAADQIELDRLPALPQLTPGNERLRA